MRRASVLSVCATLMVAASGVGAQRKISERDSIAAHAVASEALRQFQYRYYLFVWFPMLNLSEESGGGGEEICEERIVDFCYGPRNGKVALGGFGLFRVQHRLGQAVASKMYRKQTNAYLSVYTTALKAQLARIPGDRWIVGEIVRLYIDLGQYGRAEDELRRCRSDSWWCESLRAHVKHLMGEWTAADSIWDIALKALPPNERCDWLNPSRVVADKDARRLLNEMSCDARDRISRRTWWLSDPFFTRPGNERRSAHFSRIVSVALELASHRRSWATPAMIRENHVPPMAPPMIPDPNLPMLRHCGSYGLGRYGNKFDPVQSGLVQDFLFGYPEMVMRLGIPYFCSSKWSMGETQLDVLVQYPTHWNSFVPSPAAYMSHLEAPPSAWNLKDAEPFEWFAEWTRPIHELTYQDAYFKRDDSVRVLVAATPPLSVLSDAAGVLLSPPPSISGTLWMQEDFDLPSRTTRSEGRGTIIFDATLPPSRSLASVELALPRNAMGRVRFGTGPQAMWGQRVGISDILLTQPTSSPPSTLEAAKPAMLATTRINASAPLGLFWEIYGLSAGDTPKVSLLIVPQRGDKPLRLGRAEQRVSGVDALVTEWTEPAVAGRAIEGRGLNVSLAGLRRGTYTLSIAVSLDGQEWAESVRTILLER